MSQTPFMQFYVGDYLADTTHLTTEQHGAYMLLLMTMWRHGSTLPSDPKKLARICRTTDRKWPAIWDEISAFFVVDGDKISNPRLTKEYQKAEGKSKLRANAGSLGGKAKALKSKKAPLANASVLPQHLSEPEPYREEDTNVSLSVSTDAPRPANDFSKAVSRYNEAAVKAGWPQVQKLTSNRSKQVSRIATA